MTRSAPISSIAVIVVNYGTADLAVVAVESVLQRHHGGREIEVHLVDNASPGGDANTFTRAHAERGWGGRVTLHLEAVNHGFGRANNFVLKQLATRVHPPNSVFFLNPDARLCTETLDSLAKFLEVNEEVAIAGCGIQRPDGTPVSAAFRFPGVRSEFVTSAAFGPVSRLLRKHTIALPPGLPQSSVDWVSGAAFMARFDALREVGFFDPDFFLYFEEIDMMHRIRKAGWSIWHVMGVDVVHEAGASTGLQEGRSGSGRLPPYWYESWRLYFTKRRGRAGAALVVLARLLGWNLNILVCSMRGRAHHGPRKFIRDFERYVIRPILLGRT